MVWEPLFYDEYCVVDVSWLMAHGGEFTWGMHLIFTEVINGGEKKFFISAL